jgi:light-regulated signal transduction histidine kinase (bacteriophytochrome)
MQGGALDYILKPFKLNVILPVIDRALNVQHLRRENAELHARDARRAAELAAAYQDLESFSFSISHDLRAPLRSLDAFAAILEDEYAPQLGEEGQRIVGIIRTGSRNMDRLIVGLLEFSRSGRSALQIDAVDMTLMADAAAAEAKSLYTGPAAHIEILDLPPVEADATLIRQVWCNLIGNALKYSAKRDIPKITISGRIENREATYQVQDNGAGFDMRYADKLFGAFQRLHRSEDFAGTGIGLAIVHRIIVRHGGRIWAKGAPDAGACFQFALPVKQP